MRLQPKESCTTERKLRRLSPNFTIGQKSNDTPKAQLSKGSSKKHLIKKNNNGAPNVIVVHDVEFFRSRYIVARQGREPKKVGA